MTLRTLPVAASLLAVLLVAASCGDSPINETKVPALSLEEPSAATLRLNPKKSRPQAQTKIKFRNSGEAALEVTRLEWVAKPNRLVGRGASTGETCNYDATASNLDTSGTCTGRSYCSPIQSECINAALPETPFSVEPNRLSVIETVMRPGSDEPSCPESPDDRDDLPPNYCGELVIETNANNSSDQVDSGKLRIYLTYAEGSGHIEVEPTSITLSGVSADSSASRKFTVRNTSSEEPLQIEDVRLDDQRDAFSITGGPVSTSIPANGEKNWTVEFSAPSEWDGEAIGTNVNIQSSGTNERSTLIPVTASSEQNRPSVKLAPSVLRFDDGDTEMLTITNTGAANLSMQSFSADNAYSFSFEDDASNSFQGAVPSDKVIRAGESRDVRVIFDSAADTDTAVGTLQISYVYYINDEPVSETAEVTLLGGVGDSPVGQVVPNTLTFAAAADNSQQRTFVIRNLGTKPLNIAAATLDLASSDFSLPDDPSGASIPAGGLKQVQVNYSGSDDQADVGPLKLDSNTAGAAEAMSVYLAAEAVEGGDVSAKITPGFADDATAVGDEATFSAQQSTVPDPALLDNAQWVLLSRPDGSRAFLDETGPDVSFFPDQPGEYTVSLIVAESPGSSSQTTYPFKAE